MQLSVIETLITRLESAGNQLEQFQNDDPSNALRDINFALRELRFQRDSHARDVEESAEEMAERYQETADEKRDELREDGVA